jgi:uncharacterized protein with GYD domain
MPLIPPEVFKPNRTQLVSSENGPLPNEEETSMTIYISQGRYTAAAIKGMSAKPEDRSEAVAELFAAAGARLISWYLTLGPFDWLITAKAPDGAQRWLRCRSASRPPWPRLTITVAASQRIYRAQS